MAGGEVSSHVGHGRTVDGNQTGLDGAAPLINGDTFLAESSGPVWGA